MWKDRILSALLAAALGTVAALAVIRFTPAPPPFTAAQLEQGVTYAATGVAPDEIVATLDGNSVSAELYAFWLGKACDNVESAYGMNVAAEWDTRVEGEKTLHDFIREDVLALLKQEMVLENLAAKYGVDISAETEVALDAQRDEYIAQHGEDGYRAELYKLGVSEAGYRRLSGTDYLYQALYQAYMTPGSALWADDDVLHAYAATSGWITADHILVMTVDPATNAPLSGEARERKRAEAEALLAQLRASDEPETLFAQLADERSEDPGRATSPEGYTFTHGTMVAEFDEAAHALREGEISDLVETQYGYHIILRKPLNVAEAADSVRGEYFSVIFLSAFRDAEMELAPAAERLDDRALYAALLAARKTADGAGK